VADYLKYVKGKKLGLAPLDITKKIAPKEIK
jgi:hypothetical protein